MTASKRTFTIYAKEKRVTTVRFEVEASTEEEALQKLKKRNYIDCEDVDTEYLDIEVESVE